MKLVNFTFTNEYDSQSTIQINPAFVVTLRPDGKSKTIISLGVGQITVDGNIDIVSAQLCADDQPVKVADNGAHDGLTETEAAG